MKIACQTILWGSRLDDPLDMFQTIHELGFQGVEICQPPSSLPHPSALRGIFEHLDLTFLGFYGGTLPARIDYCRKYCPENVRFEDWNKPYLCINDWDEGPCRMALDEEFELALHPHMYYKNHRLDTTSAILFKYPELKFLPDTAHLFLGRSDIIEAIKQHEDRLAAVHVKDWTPKYGRSFHRYARGFTELGNGIIDIEKVVSTLKEMNYSGWIVVEQDSTERDPTTSCEISRQWLVDHGVPIAKRQRKEGFPELKFKPREVRPPVKALLLMDTLMHVKDRETRFFWNNMLANLCKIVPCNMASLWEFSRTNGLLTLLDLYPRDIEPEEPFVMNYVNVLSGIAVESQGVVHLDPRRRYGGRTFAHMELKRAFRLSKMISIPVLNTYNINHVEMVINLYPKRRWLRTTDQELALCAQYVAIAYEAFLEDQCESAASAVSLIAATNREVKIFLDGVVRNLEDALNCEAVTIFLVDETGKKLESRATTGLEWDPSVPKAERYYQLNEGLTGRVWKNCEPLLSIKASKEEGYIRKSYEVTDSGLEACLIAPLVDMQGSVIGVIRCVNKHARRTPYELNILSERDLAIIDTVEQTMIPHLLILLAEERRAKRLGRLTHELRVPMAGLRSVVDFVEYETRQKHFEFGGPYISDILSWHALANQLLDNVDFFRYRVEGSKPKLEEVSLLKDVFPRTLNPLKPLLGERDFSHSNITIHNDIGEQRLFVDEKQFQQVFFNLLSNAVKFAEDDPENFRVQVTAKKVDDEYQIVFRDWGNGIPEKCEELIFEEGFRGPDAEQLNTSGTGIGLWVVAEIIKAHHGTIRVSHNPKPTELTIVLPEKIAEPWTP